MARDSAASACSRVPDSWPVWRPTQLTSLGATLSFFEGISTQPLFDESPSSLLSTRFLRPPYPVPIQTSFQEIRSDIEQRRLLILSSFRAPTPLLYTKPSQTDTILHKRKTAPGNV
jgi:hypothetical protein